MTVRAPAHVEPWEKALGRELCVEFLLEFGGARLYLSPRPDGKSQVAARFGQETAAALGKAFGAGYYKVPLAREYLAACLKADGASTAQIARLVRADEETVRRWLNGAQRSSQLSLF